MKNTLILIGVLLLIYGLLKLRTFYWGRKVKKAKIEKARIEKVRNNEKRH